MKKEAISTFNEGLNYDLNVLTTPNNMLTDCVNGTFITFNGDELALQNDSGNTTLRYNLGSSVNPKWIDVSLSPGFYPIAMKEYGGILYIVSACNPNSIEVWNENEIYNVDNIVKVKVGAGWNYYRCKLTPELNLPPNEYLSNWEILKESDLKRVEIGSFPSPIKLGVEKKYKNINYNVVNNKSSLYLPTVINDNMFQAGTYITFDAVNNLDTDYLSYYKYDMNGNPTYVKKIYNVKFLQQLNSGYIDLTTGLWDKFAEHTGYPLNLDDVRFWFSDNTFKFYCPNNFKGKPVITTEIETLKEFKILSSTINSSGDGYEIIIRVLLKNDNALDISRILFKYKIDDGQEKEEIYRDSVDNIFTIIKKVKIEDTKDKNGIFTYTITPVIFYEDVNITSEIPLDYYKNNNYILEGSKMLSTGLDDYIFSKSNYVCKLLGNIWTGEAEYWKLILKNKNNQNITPSLSFSEEPYYFEKYVQGENYTDDPNRIGYFTVDSSGKALFRNWSPLYMSEGVSSRKELINLLNEQQVISEDQRCTPAILTLKTNKKLHAFCESKVTLSTETGYSKTINITDENGEDTFVFDVIKNTPFTITVSYKKSMISRWKDPINETVTFTSTHEGISKSETLRFAIINKLDVICSPSSYTNDGTGEITTYAYEVFAFTPGLLPPVFDGKTEARGRRFQWRLSNTSNTYNRNNLLTTTVLNRTFYASLDSTQPYTSSITESHVNSFIFDFRFVSGVDDTYDLNEEYMNISNNSQYVKVGTGNSSEGFEIFLKSQLNVVPIQKS